MALCDVLWRFSKAEDYDFSELFAHHQLEEVDVWRKGEPLPLGKTRSDSGFNIPFEEITADQVEPALLAFLEEERALLTDLEGIGANGLVSIMLGVGPAAGAAHILDLSPSLLAAMSAQQIGLRFIACLQSDG